MRGSAETGTPYPRSSPTIRRPASGSGDAKRLATGRTTASWPTSTSRSTGARRTHTGHWLRSTPSPAPTESGPGSSGRTWTSTVSATKRGSCRSRTATATKRPTIGVEATSSSERTFSASDRARLAPQWLRANGPTRSTHGHAGCQHRADPTSLRRRARHGGLDNDSQPGANGGGTGAAAPAARALFLASVEMGAGGFEPPKAEPTGLQPVPFGRSGTPPGERHCSQGGTERLYLQNLLAGVLRSQR